MSRPKRSSEEARMALEVGGRLSQIREQERLSQDEFAERLGSKNRRTLGQYEAGRTMLPTGLARRICDEFDVSFDWLMTGKEPRRRSDVLKEAQSRRAEEEARQTLRAIQDVVERLGWEDTYEEERSLNGLFKTALRVSLAKLEREFQEKKGVKQFASFLEDFITTAMEIWGAAGTIRKEVLLAESSRLRKKEDLQRQREREREKLRLDKELERDLRSEPRRRRG